MATGKLENTAAFWFIKPNQGQDLARVCELFIVEGNKGLHANIIRTVNWVVPYTIT